MRIRFTHPFDWDPPERKGRVTLAFVPGDRTVRRECGEAAIKAGKAIPLEGDNGAENRGGAAS